MAEPRVPGGRDERLDLPCGETVPVRDLDMGVREFDCACGETHAVVMDVHPLGRFVPETLEEVLSETVETTDEGPFGIKHVMGMVLEEFPDEVASADVSGEADVGYALVWATDFDSRRLHEVVVELLVELMEHAMSHAGDGDQVAAFEERMHEFDVGAFVEEYRRRRDFESAADGPV